MAQRPRNWAALAPGTRQRYIGKGIRLGQTAAQVEAYYTSGGNMAVYRGHQAPGGLSERQWKRLRDAAKGSRMSRGTDPPNNTGIRIVLEALLAKGFAYTWILSRLSQQKESRDNYLNPINVNLRRLAARGLPGGDPMAGRQPGNRRWHARNHTADIEIYYYH